MRKYRVCLRSILVSKRLRRKNVLGLFLPLCLPANIPGRTFNVCGFLYRIHSAISAYSAEPFQPTGQECDTIWSLHSIWSASSLRCRPNWKRDVRGWDDDIQDTTSPSSIPFPHYYAAMSSGISGSTSLARRVSESSHPR